VPDTESKSWRKIMAALLRGDSTSPVLVRNAPARAPGVAYLEMIDSTQ